MLFFLILSFLVILFNIFIIGVLLSKVSINIDNLNAFTSSGLEGVIIDKLQMSVDLYLYRVIKLLSIKFYKDYLKVGFVKVYYYKILKYKNKIIDSTVSITKILLGKNRLTLSILNPNIEKFYMNLSLCSENAAFTSITSSLIGTTTSMILSKYVKKYDEENIYYKIAPVYFNINGFRLELKTIINFNTFNILVFLYDYYLLKNNN